MDNFSETIKLLILRMWKRKSEDEQCSVIYNYGKCLPKENKVWFNTRQNFNTPK